MKRMWQKYTPGKRVLALFLAIIMMLDPFAVSAATTEDVSQEVEQEVVVEEIVSTESTETIGENLVEEGTTEVDTEVVSEIETEAESMVPETEVEAVEVETENEEIKFFEEEMTVQATGTRSEAAITMTDDNRYLVYYPNIVNYYVASNMSVNSVNLCVRLDPNQVDISQEPVVTVESDGGWFTVGQEVPMYGYNTDEEGYVYYNRYLTGGGTEWPYEEFEQGVLTVTQGDATCKFIFARADLQYTVDSRAAKYFSCNTVSRFAEGDVVTVTSKNHAPGVFGYITFDNANLVTASDITDAEAKSAWNANYAATYGEYGADGKYYCFTYGTDNTKTWLPELNMTNAGSTTMHYNMLDAVGVMRDIEYSVNVFPDYALRYEDVELILQEDGVNKVPYSKGDLRFYVYKDGIKVTGTDATVSIEGYDGTIGEALSAKCDENNNWYIEIDDEKVKDYEDNVVGLEQSPYSKSFSIGIVDKGTEQIKSFYYVISPAELQIQKESGNVLFLESETVEVDFSEQWMYLALPVDSGDTRYVNPTVTYSDASVLQMYPQGGDYSYGRFRITPKKLGTTKVTISYMIDGVKETYTANIKLVSKADLEFGLIDGNGNWSPFVNNTLTAEQGVKYDFFTNVSPVLLSNITITSANPSIFEVWGNITESYFEQNGETYLSRSYAIGQPQQLGETTITFSAKYNGKTVSQTVKVTVKEASGVSVKRVYVDAWSEDGYRLDNKVTDVGIDNSNRDVLYAICDDVVVGTDESGNPVYENTYADKDNYDIVIIDEWTNEPSDYFTIKFINESIFTIVPNEEKVTTYVYNQILRITSKEDNTKKAEVRLNYNERAGLYESYADGVLSSQIEAIPVVEGAVTTVYLAVGAGADVNNLSVSNIDYYGVAVQKKVVESSETRTVIELQFTYAPSDYIPGYFYTYITAGNYDNSTEAYIYPMKATDTYVPGFSQHAISEFYRAADDSKDISGGMRYGDFEYAFRTINGKKVATIAGYLGNASQAWLEKSLQLPIIVEAGNSYISVVQTVIPIIGMEDGAFDTRKGYTEPDVVSIFAGHTYFGQNQSGLVNPNGGRVLFDWWQGEAEIEGEQVFSTYNGMLFVEQQDGTYKCVDTGNLSVAPIILDSITLYANSPMPRAVIGMRNSSNVSGYRLANDYLLTEDGTATELKVTVENGNYVVSTNSGTTVTPGVYYLALTPQKYIYAFGGDIDLPTIRVKVVVNTKNEAPTVTINNVITLNKYLNKDAIVLIGETNTFGTATTVSFTAESAAKAAGYGLSLIKNGDNKTVLYWDAVDREKLPKEKLEFELQFEVEGFTPSEGCSIPNQKLTVNVIDEQPQTTVSTNKLTFTTFPYVTAELGIGITNGFANNNVKNILITPVLAPKGVDLWEAYSLITFFTNARYYNTVQVQVHNNVEPGIYEFAIQAELNTDKEQCFAAPVNVTIEVKGTKPVLQFDGKVNVTLDSVQYNTDAELPSISFKSEPKYMSVYNGAGIAVKSEMVSKPNTATGDAVVIRAIYEDAFPENGELRYYEVGELKLVADVAKDAPAGTYKLNVKVPLDVNGDIVYSKVPVSVKVENKLPVFKLSTATVTLDGSMIGNPVSTQLMLDAGYTLVGIEYDHPTQEAEECLDIGMCGDGMILFTMKQSGMSKNAVYKITPLVETANGEIIKLKPVSITVKVTYSNKAVLSAKTKTININPYAGSVVADPQFTVKNAQNVMFYEIFPTSEAAKNAAMQVTIDAKGKIHVSNCENVANGKYTYNVVQHNEGGFTKPVTITLNVARKALTIKPENSKPILYADYCNGFPVPLPDGSSIFYIMATFPVELEGAENLNLVDYLAKDENGLNATNDLYEDWAILTYFEETTEGETSLIVAVPYGITPNNIVITPNVAEDVNKEFAKLKMNITVKAGKPTLQFEEKSVTLNRFATDNVTNVIADTEGYLMYGMSVDSITLKGKNENVRDLYFEYDNTTDRNSVNIKIKPACVDTIPEGIYVVTTTPQIAYIDGYDENDEPYLKPAVMDPCTFEIKVEDTKAAITISEKTVNLYPELGGANTATVTVRAKSGSTDLGISAVEAYTVGTAVVTDTENANNVTFTVAEGTAKGTNKYDIKVFAKRYGGNEAVEIGTVKNAITVNVKTLPVTLKMSNTKLKFNPYLQTDVIMEVADKEIKEMLASDNYRFAISSPVELDSKYEKAVPQLNDVLELETTTSGQVVITAKALPTAKATYYYKCVYTLHNVDNTGGYKNYEVKFSVTVDVVKPTAQVSAKTVTLDNANLENNAYSDIMLKTDADVWSMADVNQNYKVLDSKKNDVTNKFAVSVICGQIAIAPKAYDQGNPVEVPKGNYTLSVVPVITNGKDTLELAEVKVTVKVTSSRPAYVKNTATLTVNTWTNSRVATPVTLKSGESFVSGTQIVCTKAPAGVTINNGNVAGLTVGFELDGTLWAQADRNVKAGSYTLEVKPVAAVNGFNMILEPLKLTVKVDTKQPKAVVSDKAVATVNTSYTGYSKDLTISLAGADMYAFGFTKADITTKETNAAKKADAEKLLSAMTFTVDNGLVTLNVNLNGNASTVAKGTYKFVIKDATVKSGNYMTVSDEAYKLGDINFSVKVEDAKAKVTAKSTGTIDLLKRDDTAVDVQLSFSKQVYESVDKITDVRILNGTSDVDSYQFYVSDATDLASGKFTVSAYSWGNIAAKNQQVTVEVTTESGNVYTTKVTLKVTQSNVKITAAKTATYFTSANIAEIPVAVSDESVGVGYVSLASAKIGAQKLNLSDFSCSLGYYNGQIIQLQSDNDLSKYEGKTMTCIFEVEPSGMASNKKPTKVTVNIVIK